jgi:hypothetical protein
MEIRHKEDVYGGEDTSTVAEVGGAKRGREALAISFFSMCCGVIT